METTTLLAATLIALGTLLPILMEAGVMGTMTGKAVLVHGAVGDFQQAPSARIADRA